MFCTPYLDNATCVVYQVPGGNCKCSCSATSCRLQHQEPRLRRPVPFCCSRLLLLAAPANHQLAAAQTPSREPPGSSPWSARKQYIKVVTTCCCCTRHILFQQQACTKHPKIKRHLGCVKTPLAVPLWHQATPLSTYEPATRPALIQ